MKHDIIIDITGREHNGKTSLAVLFSQFLTQHGIEHAVAHTDPQLDDKLDHPEDCIARLTGENAPSILIREVNTGPRK